MNWSVTYRDKSGVLKEEFVEAKNRKELFRQLSEMGISAVRVTESVCNRNKRSSGERKNPLSRSNFHISRKLIAILFLAALAGSVCWLYLFRKDAVPASKEETAQKATKDVTPQKPIRRSSNIQAEQQSLPRDKRRDIKGNIINIPKNPWGQPIPPELEYKPIWEYTTEDYAKVDPGYLERHKVHRERQEAIPWKTDADRQLSILLFAKDGNMGLLTPFNRRFKEQFLKSLETPIIVSKDDPPELKEQKREMNEVKIHLKEQMDAGEDIVEILNNEYKNAQKIRTLRENLQAELRNIEKTATSVEEVQDYIDAANKMLDEYGARHVGLPLTLTRKRLERQAQTKYK